MKQVGFGAAVAAAILLATLPLIAQRTTASTYDASRQVKLQGAVTRIEWVNPRAYFFIDVKDAAGTVTNWAVEFGSPLDLERDGWSRDTLHIGDVLDVQASPAWGVARQALARSVTLLKGGRKLFVVRTARAAAVSNGPAPRRDGHVSLGPPPGQRGYWRPAAPVTLFESTGVNVPMNGEGLLLNIADADRVAPLQPWARALYLHRQRTLLKDDPLARCLPPGGPRQFQMSSGVQFVEQPELGRILVLLGGGDRNWRVIYTDGRPAAQSADVVLGYYGTSVGRWEGDALVVDAIGFNERFWLTSGGLPHTEALHLVERFSRPNLGTLKYEVTVDDPRTYTRRWTGGWTLQWAADQEIEEYFCEENAESTFLR
jgi:hypothetical protein